MSRKKAQQPEAAEPKKRSFIRRLAFQLFLAMIVIGVIVLVISRSGWFLAQAERRPDTKRAADRITPLIPAKLRAPGYDAALSSENEAVRKGAEAALAKISAEDRAAVANLLAALKSKEAEVRKDALEALANMGQKARETTPQVVEALRDTNESVRAKAAEALGRIKARAEVAIPALKEAMGDTALTVRESAQAAIEKIRERKLEIEEKANSEE